RIPEPDGQIRDLNRKTIELLERFLQRSTRIQVLESGNPYLTMALREAAFTNLMGGSQQPENGHLQVGVPADVQLAALPEEQLDAILIEEVADLPVSIDVLVALARSRLAPGGLLYLRHVRGFSGAVFIPTHRFIVDFNLLVGLLERQGLETLQTVESGGDDGLLPGSFHLILRRL
ncbi:MAG: hypothetical protein KDK34_18825, partial [Leptospiraceae bacterium]|nr:hypothetical protein [Leptospiraceae bacterium]